MVIEMKNAPFFDKNLLIEFGRFHVTVNKELAHDGNPEYTMANQRLCKNSWTSPTDSFERAMWIKENRSSNQTKRFNVTFVAIFHSSSLSLSLTPIRAWITLSHTYKVLKSNRLKLIFSFTEKNRVERLKKFWWKFDNT